ncbi:MAG: exodeoxyribonuclease VII large subunit, partial [Candidatus Marinimicrobia bacterium]|nr:exodeoxyribonuclease VII large subunit [Candidatus Neomarinimicrobiota bacterium]
MSAAAAPAPLSISELTRRIRLRLEDDFGTVWVEGEISNLKRQPSGHMYFTLKDGGAQLSAVLFAGSQRGLAFQPAEGQQVRARGQISVYEPRGQYQLIVRELAPAGQGALLEAFEQLKRQLEADGLFAAGHKQKLPLLPARIGLITSPTGAAVRDILQVLGRRYPRREILLAPTLVQGEKAAAQLKGALEWLDAHDAVDVIIIGRGGGSLEDLWCFNDEALARAVYACRIPVISAVGHETDFTICDFVADLRAPTPSAAAELVIRPYADWSAQFADYDRRLR